MLGRLGAFQERCQDEVDETSIFGGCLKRNRRFGHPGGRVKKSKKRPLFLRGRGIAFLFVIPALPPPLPLALLSSYSFHPSSVRCSSACLSLLALVGVILDASWGVLGASWVVLSRLGTAWSALGPSRGLLGPLESSWRPYWTVLGPLRYHSGAILGFSWAVLLVYVGPS